MILESEIHRTARQKIPSARPLAMRSAELFTARQACRVDSLGPENFLAASARACTRCKDRRCALRRQPAAMRSICCAALRPSLPAQIRVRNALPLIRLERRIVGAVEEVLHHSGHPGKIFRGREYIAVRREHIFRLRLGRRAAARPAYAGLSVALPPPRHAPSAACRRSSSDTRSIALFMSLIPWGMSYA